jgi:3-hydroxymyristoyl/3-hydroxydecanoyl-(acyl carrier protein) dehydratase
MGLDAISKGTLSYRAIDSSMTAYSERPFRVGDTLRTVLKINRFVKNGSTTLLFFTFESYNGNELIAITEATGGFFTKADLASTKGIIQPKIQMRKDTSPKEFIHFSKTTRTSYEKNELDAFYVGDYETCFGVKRKPTQKEVYYLPYDMKMIDRVTEIDYNGGIYGRGYICGEKQITPDMWPFKVHFKNDPVFPAIITSDGVSQLGMFLFAHAGLLGKFDNANFTMVKGNCTTSRFRGQVRYGYSTLRYKISVREVIETENHIIAWFDAAIFNDDIQIMQIDSYALKITSAND